MIVALADEIDSEEALSKFRKTGLGWKDTRIQRQITNSPRSITTAARRVIMESVRTKDNHTIAYTEIKVALEKGGLILISLIQEVLEVDMQDWLSWSSHRRLSF